MQPHEGRDHAGDAAAAGHSAIVQQAIGEQQAKEVVTLISEVQKRAEVG